MMHTFNDNANICINKSTAYTHIRIVSAVVVVRACACVRLFCARLSRVRRYCAAPPPYPHMYV